jgi:carbamoyl-phosphate synthase/aspartate carbamoyltransferase
MVVSIKEPKLYKPHPDKALKLPSGRTLRIVVLDVGMKFNQIRCFTSRGVELKVLPWDSPLPDPEPHDGLFISNGPGDPSTLASTVEHLKNAIKSAATPIFGICLGHQLLSLAAGAKTEKMKFGNRGHNIPCTDLTSGRCYITSQNHGYAVVAKSLPEPWEEFFVNANDGSNEGIYHSKLPFFSVQFHPESTPGPRDTEFLFDVFVDVVKRSAEEGKLAKVIMPGAKKHSLDGTVSGDISHRVNVKKCLVLGSGGLSIGQAGEFDYSGSQVYHTITTDPRQLKH